MASRELNEDEKRLYQKNLERQLAEKESLMFSIEHEKLMHDKGYMHNYKERMKGSEILLEKYKGELEACEFAIADCTDKLKNGVTLKEEK